jgi:hypothetical protein
MDSICHRCGTPLNHPDELFCPHCGAPQLRYEPADEPVASVPMPQTAGSNLEQFSSKAAILSALIVALLVAIPIGLLSSIYDFSRLWVLAGGVASAVLYRRQAGRPPTGRLGWRIGGLAGLLAAFISMALYSLRSVVQRFALHSDAPVLQAHLLAQQFAAAANQAGRSNPQTADAAAQLTRFWLSPDGAAAMALFMAAMFTVSVVLFAAAGGAIGARIVALGKKTESSSR